MRRVLAALIVVGLVIGVIVFWPRSDPDDPSGTIAGASTTTTATVARTTTTPSSTSTSSTTGDGHVVETVAEAEAITAGHYFRWFRGIYDQDEALIRATVILDSQVEAAVNQFGRMEFAAEPSQDSFTFSDTEILRADDECLALWTRIKADFRPGDSIGVTVFRRVGDEWKFLSSWQSRDDLWEADCEASL